MAKQKDFCIEFKLMFQQVRELESVYGLHLTSLNYEDEHEALLSEHIKDMHARLASMAAKLEFSVKKKACLNMNNSEAMAFYQIWNVVDTSRFPLANVILCDMIKRIDKLVKSPKKWQG